jgi:pullulanase
VAWDSRGQSQTSITRSELALPGSGAGQNPVLIASRIDGAGLGGHSAVMTLIKVAPTAQTLQLPEEVASRWQLHPVQRTGADERVRREARFANGRFEVPACSAAVFVRLR